MGKELTGSVSARKSGVIWDWSSSWPSSPASSPASRLTIHLWHRTLLRSNPMRNINWRALLFVALLLSIVGTPAYVYLRAATSGGISQRGDLVEVDIYAMSNFEFDQIDGVTADVPKRYRDLDGKRVLLCGEMWVPRSAGDQVDSFDLV